MKKIGLICLCLCVVAAFFVPAMPVSAQAEQNNTITQGSHSVDAQIPLLGSDRLVSNVQSAVLYETNTQTLMHAYNADEQMYPASMVKILTALIVAEQADLSAAVTVTDSVLKTLPYDAVSADLVADEILTVNDLLYCMLVGSANDAAAVLAEHTFGSQSAFVAEMNRYAQELGCVNTNFTNPHGLHDEQQYTTARDMARILAAAMENETFVEIFGAVYYTVPQTNKSEARNLSSGNYLMNNDSVQIYYDSRVTGSRTSVTSTGYLGVASAAKSDDMSLICIIMGSQSVYKEDGYTVQSFGGYKETSLLLDAGFDGFTAKQIVYEGQTIAQYSVVDGASDVVVGAAQTAYTVLPKEVTISDLDFRSTDMSGLISAPVEAGQVLSGLEVWYGDVCVAHIDLCAMSNVPVYQTQNVSKEAKQSSPVLKIVLIVFAAIILAAVVFLVLARTVFKIQRAAQRTRSRRNRRNRRRNH